MFRELSRKFRSYLGHELGIAAVMLALLLPMIIASAGVAVDLSVAYNAKNRLGNALDKAVLAAASSSGLSTADLNARFQAFFAANYPASKYGTPYNVSLTVDGSVMTATASATVPTSFMTIFGINSLTISDTSQVVQTLAGVEAVLVLDTTGSMAGNNITALKADATSFINTMFASITDPKYLKIGIVPWSDNVNVGPYGIGQNPDGTMFESGQTFVSPPASDSYVTPASSITYSSNLNSTEWGGCVVEPNAASITEDNSSPNWIMYRYPPPNNNTCLQYGCNQYDCLQQTCSQYQCQTYVCLAYACAQYNCTAEECGSCPRNYTLSSGNCCPNSQDTFMSGSSCCPKNDVLSTNSSNASGCCPTGDVLNSNGTSCCPTGDVLTSNTSYCCPSGYTYSSSHGTTSCTKTGKTTISPAPSSASASSSGATTTCSSQTCGTFGNTCITQGACSQYSTTQCQTYSTTQCVSGDLTCTTPGSATNGAACVAGQTNKNICLQYSTGPNSGCTSVPVLPMTSDQSALLAEINALPTANNTYPDVGMVWGWRLISPGFPFTEGAAYSDTTWSKTVIIMTDGNATINTVMSGEGAYGATGTSMTSTDQNNKFEQICTNMKAQGIRIYTITFQAAINATTQQYYSECATNPSMYYNAPTNADLTTAFQSIATQLSQLHLTK